MKKRVSQNLSLNKTSISKLDSLIVIGGRLRPNQETFPVGVCTCNLTCHSCPDCPADMRTAL